MPKKIVFGEELRTLCTQTMTLISKAVTSSLGPSGKLSLLDMGKTNKISKDGVSIARHCLPLPDEAMNLIGSKILEIAAKTNSESGDGTTTSIVLANALFREAVKQINEKRLDPVMVKDEIEKTLPTILRELEKLTKKINSQEELEHVAAVSANNDLAIGKLIAEALYKTGEFGFTQLTAGEAVDKVTFSEGMQISKGCTSERFLKGATYREFENANILVFDGQLDDAAILDMLYAQVPSQPFVVIAELGEMAQKYLLENTMAGTMTAVNIFPPMFKGVRVRLLQDIATFTGAELVSPHTHNLSVALDKKVLGKAKRVTFNKYNTTIVEGAGDKEAILNRIEILQEEMEATRSQYEKDSVRERISNLNSTAAVIEVGGRTEDEILEKKDRFEDALNAGRSALQEGIVPGGGFALFKIAQKLKGKSLGEKIFKSALEAPLRQIVSNTGMDVEEVVQQVRKSNKGYNAKTHKLTNLMASGIVDPVKSTKCGLKNAVSIVDLLINLEVLSVNVLDKDNLKDTVEALRGINAQDV
jgi:chaperonin GroEL